MADSTTNIPQISASQASKEVTMNALVDAASQGMIYGRNADTSSGLTFGYLGGRYNSTQIANGTVSLTASNTNYIVAAKSNGAVSVSTSATNWNDSSNYERLYLVVAGGSSVTSYEDHRNFMGGGSTSTQPFDVTAFYPGVPTSSAKVLRVPIARAVSFAANFSGSYGKASAASTGTATFDIQKNGSSIGTMVFTASASATFTTSGGTSQSFAAGDVLSIIAPSSADATLADVGVVLAGTR